MRIGMVAVLVVIAAYNAQAKDAPAYEKGVLIQMESSSGGYAEKDRKTIAGEIFGTDAQHKNKLLLRVPDADGKEREYFVLSMTPRSDVRVANRPTNQEGAQ